MNSKVESMVGGRVLQHPDNMVDERSAIWRYYEFDCSIAKVYFFIFVKYSKYIKNILQIQ